MAVDNPIVEYRDIPGFPGYRVGDDGSVWSCLVRVYLGRQGSHCVTGVEWHRMKPNTNNSGHFSALLYREKKQYRRFIHRLVLLAFVGPRPEGMEACHFPDHDPSNNRLTNLRWDTHKANCDDRDKHDRTYRGERHHRAKLNAAQVSAIKIASEGGESIHAMARKYGVNRWTIKRIIRGTSWCHVA